MSMILDPKTGLEILRARYLLGEEGIEVEQDMEVACEREQKCHRQPHHVVEILDPATSSWAYGRENLSVIHGVESA
jgi:hypothetical protein